MATTRGPGRPRYKRDEEKMDAQVWFRVTWDERKELERQADEQGISSGEMLRRLVRRTLLKGRGDLRGVQT